MTHAHDHRETAASRSRGALLGALGLTGGFTIVEFAAGLWTGSLSLLADAAHMVTDVGGLGLALFAIWIATRPPTPAKTYGFYRVEILAALVNGVVLLAIAAVILVEAYERVMHPKAVLAGPMLAVAVTGLGVNLASAGLLRHGAGSSLNVRAAYLEVLSDALSSVAVIIAGTIILATGWTPIDPILSAVIGLAIVPRTWRLLVQAVNVLLEGTPAHIRLDEIERAMCTVDGVRRVHDLHVWTLTSGRDAMSAHVVVDDLSATDRLLDRLHALLHAQFGIDHTTIQVETEPPAVLTIQRHR